MHAHVMNSRITVITVFGENVSVWRASRLAPWRRSRIVEYLRRAKAILRGYNRAPAHFAVIA
jgi:hypothetical protein